MGYCSKLFKLISATFVVFVGILLGPSRLPDNVKFTNFEIPPTKNLGKGFAKNDLLNNAERLFENEIKGPEAFEVVDGELYTTLHGGFVAKIYEDQVIPVVKFGEPCVGWWEESKCGRPLGVKALGRDHLVVADAYFGIYKYNLKTKQTVNLVDNNTVIDGQTSKIFNSVEIAKDGSIYWTHSSSDFQIQDGIYAFLADGSGRLVKYDPVTQKNVVLLKNLYFPNGLALSPDEDYLLVAETGQSRILKYHLKGPKKFTTEVFIEGLPGVPDNLRRNGDDGYFVPLVITKDEGHPLAFQLLSNFPSFRKFGARFLSLIELVLEEVDKIYPSYYTKRAIHFVGHLESVSILFTAKTIILLVDLDGNVVTSYHGSDGTVTSISDVIPHNGYLYLGSPINNYLARVKLSELGIKVTKRSVPPVASAPPLSTTIKPPTAATRPPPPPTTTTRPPTAATRPPPPPTTTTRPPTAATRPPPPPTTTTRPPTAATRPPPPPTTTTRPPTAATRPPPPPTTTTRPPTAATRPPPPPTTTTRPPTAATRPPPPPTTTTRPPTAATRPPPPTTESPPPTPKPRTTSKPSPPSSPSQTGQTEGQRKADSHS